MNLRRFYGESGAVFIDPESVVAINPAGERLAGICSTVWTKAGQALLVRGSTEEVYAALAAPEEAPNA